MVRIHLVLCRRITVAQWQSGVEVAGSNPVYQAQSTTPTFVFSWTLVVLKPLSDG